MPYILRFREEWPLWSVEKRIYGEEVWVELDDVPDVRTKRDGLHRLAEELVALCDKKPPLLEDGRVDQGWVTWQKLRIDTRKWNASRILPKEYGEHVALKGDTTGGGLNIRIDLGP